MGRRLSALFVSVLLQALLCHAAASQCSTPWSSAAPIAQLSGQVNATTVWDPDGNGPEPFRLVVGGLGLRGGTAATPQRMMTWDGRQWEPLGDSPGLGQTVGGLTVWNGLLVATGRDVSSSGTASIAVWDGSAWQPLGAGPGFFVEEAAVWNGNLVAAGFGSNNPRIAVWNGAAWSNLPPPPQLSQVSCITSYQGLLCVGGSGPSLSGGALERWNGTTWLPTIPANGSIQCFAVRTFSLLSTLYVGGAFTTIGSGASATQASRIASTTGGSAFVWSAIGSGLAATCLELHVRATSALGAAVVARTTSSATPVMRLDVGSFVPMGATQLLSLSFYDGSYYGGSFGAPSHPSCARYDGSAWVPVIAESIDGEVRALTASGTDMIVGGTIQSTAGPLLNRIARWNGTSFLPVGSGIGGLSVDALLTLGNGDVVAGGLFATAGGGTASNIARWNGSTWSTLGAGCDQQVLALARMPNGDVVAGGRFATAGGVACARIARWNGTAWSPLGSGMNGDVLALAVRSDGRLFAGGAFTTAGGLNCNRIAQWNGVAWAPLGSGCDNDVRGLTVRHDGDLVAVGAFGTAGGLAVDRCARWNGTTWFAMGANSGDPAVPAAVFTLQSGDLIAGRGFHSPGVNPDSGIARWDGSTWSGFGSGLAAATAGSPVTVRALAQRADGVVFVGGNFGIAGGLAARGLAALTSSCPASAASYGAGCTAAGPLTMTAETLPWLGSTFRTVTTGIAPGSVCFQVSGLAQVSIPLSSIVPQGDPGCSLLARNQIVHLVLPDASGTARAALAMPASASALGFPFFQQLVTLELGGGGALVAVRGSNGIAATIGTF